MTDLDRRIRITRCGRATVMVTDWRTGAPLLQGHRDRILPMLFAAGYRRRPGGDVWILPKWPEKEVRA